jgi:lipoprotein-releasing system ATP-binding protein
VADALVRVEQVVKDYVSDSVVTRVLHDVDLAMAEGEFAALEGPSGSGKSTLLNLMGLLDRPTSGRIWLRGQDTTTLDSATLTRFRGRTVGFVFQFHHLLPAFTALENVYMPILADRGRPDPDMRRTAAELLAAVGLGDKGHKRATQLSGGEQQRVAIARALAMRPALVLADEPTGNLDQETGNHVFELMRRLAAERGTTFLVVTHDDRIARSCDRIIELVDGRITRDEAVRRTGPG